MTRAKIELLQDKVASLEFVSELIKIRELRNLIAHEYANDQMMDIYATVMAMSQGLLQAASNVTVGVANLVKRHTP
jgi:uncharacterized protein YutE (UPF0331/DUF86 family)